LQGGRSPEAHSAAFHKTRQNLQKAAIFNTFERTFLRNSQAARRIFQLASGGFARIARN
jgi:hypothetical protein